MVAPPKKRNRNHADPVFSVTELYEKMMRPTVSSKKLRQTMSAYRDVLRRDVDNDTLEAARPDNNLQVSFFRRSRRVALPLFYCYTNEPRQLMLVLLRGVCSACALRH